MSINSKCNKTFVIFREPNISLDPTCWRLHVRRLQQHHGLSRGRHRARVCGPRRQPSIKSTVVCWWPGDRDWPQSGEQQGKWRGSNLDLCVKINPACLKDGQWCGGSMHGWASHTGDASECKDWARHSLWVKKSIICTSWVQVKEKQGGMGKNVNKCLDTLNDLKIS